MASTNGPDGKGAPCVKRKYALGSLAASLELKACLARPTWPVMRYSTASITGPM